MAHPSEPKIQRLALAHIEGTEHRLRPVSEAGVQGLIASIAQIGVIKDAIHVRKMRRASGERLVLMAGGHCLKCRDGDKTNTDPANWLAIPRALLPRLNGRWTGLSYDAAEPELKPLILAVAKLHHAARKAGRKAGRKTGKASDR